MTAAASDSWHRRAVEVMPGGVNSPVRAFGAVGGAPLFAAAASGPWVTTVDGDRLVDFVASWGALLYGHADPEIVDAVAAATRRGSSFGLSTSAEVELAELIVALVPSVEVIRMVNSGTEATAAALRVARAATGRSAVVKFEGCYHGHADAFLVSAGSGAATLGVPSSPGVPERTVADTRVARYNDLASVEAHLAAGGVAAVVVEPVAGNMGVVPPGSGFLEGLRRLCDDHGSVLIFDEVMTGFRVAPGGAQERFGVMPDLTCLGKVVAGGTPAAAYGGKRELMRLVAPDGPVYQAGTLAGNPLATAAGLACLRRLADDPTTHGRLERIGARVERRLGDAIDAAGIPACVQRVGAMLTVFFGTRQVTSWDDAAAVDTGMYGRFFRQALAGGVLLPPSAYEAMFLMTSHEEVLETTADILADAVGAAA